MQALTKLVDELAQVLQQTRETQAATKDLAEEVLAGGVSDFPTAEIPADAHNALQLRIQLQELTQFQHDAVETADAIAALVGSIRDSVEKSSRQWPITAETIRELYRERIKASEVAYQTISKNRKELLDGLARKARLLRILQSRITCISQSRREIIAAGQSPRGHQLTDRRATNYPAGLYG